MVESEFNALVKDNFFLRRLPHCFQTEADLVYLGRENLEFLARQYEAELDFNRRRYELLKPYEQTAFDAQKMTLGETIKLEEAGLSVQRVEALLAEPAVLSDFLTVLEGRIDKAKRNMENMRRLMKGARSKPVVASWRNANYYSEGDSCMYFAQIPDDTERFHEVEIVCDRGHRSMIIDGQFRDGRKGGRMLIAVQSACGMLARDFFYLRHHIKYARLWFQLEKYGENTGNSTLHQLERAFLFE